MEPLGDGFYLLNGIIPISRIKKIYFQSKGQMEVTIGNIRISTAFVPKKWLEVDTSPQIKKFDIEKLKSKNRLQSIDYQKR